MQLSSLVCSPAKWLLDNMEGNLKDIVHSKTYGSNPWPMQFQKVFYTDIYNHGQGYWQKMEIDAFLDTIPYSESGCKL